MSWSICHHFQDKVPSPIFPFRGGASIQAEVDDAPPPPAVLFVVGSKKVSYVYCQRDLSQINYCLTNRSAALVRFRSRKRNFGNLDRLNLIRSHAKLRNQPGKHPK
jgi:hypothetical protein